MTFTRLSDSRPDLGDLVPWKRGLARETYAWFWIRLETTSAFAPPGDDPRPAQFALLPGISVQLYGRQHEPLEKFLDSYPDAEIGPRIVLGT